jgi:hypothetical protein
MAGKPQLAQCPKCQGFTLTAAIAPGVDLAVDLTPLKPQGIADAIVSGVGLWASEKGPDGAVERLTPASGSPRPQWAPASAQKGPQALHAEHPCRLPQRPIKLKEPEKGPQAASATSGSGRDGFHLPGVLAGATRAPERPSPASHATLRRSKAVRCSTCNRLIDQRQPHFAIQWENIHWAVHEECP